MDNLTSKSDLFAQSADGGRLLWTYYVELKILVSAVQFRPSALPIVLAFPKTYGSRLVLEPESIGKIQPLFTRAHPPASPRTEVQPDVYRLAPPRIPHPDPLLQDLEMLRVRHRSRLPL